jgi:hypothetical protein
VGVVPSNGDPVVGGRLGEHGGGSHGPEGTLLVSEGLVGVFGEVAGDPFGVFADDAAGPAAPVPAVPVPGEPATAVVAVADAVAEGFDEGEGVGVVGAGEGPLGDQGQAWAFLFRCLV